MQHFNNTPENIKKYSMDKIIKRFNKIFPYIGLGDNFLDKYQIPIPEHFDCINKYLMIKYHDVIYIKLRLCDSKFWDVILTELLDHPIKIVKDYETTSKPIKDLYIQFKEQYKLPENFFNELRTCKYLDYYYSPQEKEKYLLEWNEKVTGPCKPFSFDEYNLYESISNENKYMDVIQANHYLDEGCMCNKCEEKRKNITHKILNGIEVNERINHSETKNEIMTEKINNYFKITPSQKKAIINSKLQNMKNIVNIRR